ncbi:MAG: tyrosine-type recombinase/integrase [Isosphaeraceae bacterium]
MGRASLEAVAPPGIDDYVRGRLEAGASPRTVNLQVSVLRRMLAWAREHRLIDHNPLERWKPVRDPGTCRRRALTPEEVRRLLDAAPPWRRILWMTMAATGIRKGEACRVLVSDFDPGRRVIRLRPEITKTSRGRICPIPSGLGRLLEGYLERRGRNEPGSQRGYLATIGRRLAEEGRAGRDDLPRADRLRRMEAAATEFTGHRHLFANSKGMQIRHNLDREFRGDLRRAGIDGPGLSIHSLRYTANTSLLAAGVPETVVRARMGHVTQRMTDRYYDPDGDDGKGTGAMAALIGVEDRDLEAALAHPSGPCDPSPGIPGPEPIRPTAELLGCLSKRFSNVAIGKILGVSEAAVRKALRRMGIVREKRIHSSLSDCEAALVRSEIRLAMVRRTAGSGGDDRRFVGRAG